VLSCLCSPVCVLCSLLCILTSVDEHRDEPQNDTVDLCVLSEIEDRLRWLSVRMIDHANSRGDTEIKVGGHQASSASMTTIMTALWFAHITGNDKVAVKPHASPLFHSIKYLTGELDESYLTQLRSIGGLQSYPSRTKDPDVFDFSTGSVGLGAVAPLFAAAVQRYLDDHFDTKERTRFIAIAGDAELDEGNVWEAISDPALQGLGNVMLIIDLNRQSLDRIIPGIQAERIKQFFHNAGWQVVEAKYGAQLQATFGQPHGPALRQHIDEMTNEEYQSLFAFTGAELRGRFLDNAHADVSLAIADIADDDLASVIQNLGGHDLGVLIDAFRQCDEEQGKPSVVFAYTIKGYGLPIVGDPLNHSALLTRPQIDALRNATGLTESDEWSRFADDSPAGRQCLRVGSEVNNVPVPPRPVIAVPERSGATHKQRGSSQEAFGRVLVAYGKDAVLGPRIVTTSPDVSISTSLGGWINSHGVYSPAHSTSYLDEGRLLRWDPKPDGQHIELGISEMNLFLLLGQLGLSHEHHGEMLIPIGTVYDPFVLRGLDALIYSLYNDARFIVVGTPAGITLAPEGGAHQSTITPSVGLELPGIAQVEPAYALAVEWLLADGIAGLRDRESMYLRLSTRPIDQAPFDETAKRLGKRVLRDAVLAGGYRIKEPGAGTPVILAASGPLMPEVLAAADLLAEEGVGVTVIDVTSLDRLFRGWAGEQSRAVRDARMPHSAGHIENLILPAERKAPIVTIHDASPHAMAWLGSVFGQRVLPIGVTRFGESGTIAELYEAFSFLPEQITTAAIVALDR
jgi:pyruvate dehydrogenase E1 component